MMLHAQRDEMRNRGDDTTRVRFDCRSGYYGEAFGIMRCLQLQGYGYFGPTNLSGIVDREYDDNVTQPEQNLHWWFSRIEQEVLNEENFHGDHRCEHCLNRYKKDTKTILDRGQK
jgi:hypothetical protein